MIDTISSVSDEVYFSEKIKTKNLNESEFRYSATGSDSSRNDPNNGPSGNDKVLTSRSYRIIVDKSNTASKDIKSQNMIETRPDKSKKVKKSLFKNLDSKKISNLISSKSFSKFDFEQRESDTDSKHRLPTKQSQNSRNEPEHSDDRASQNVKLGMIKLNPFLDFKGKFGEKNTEEKPNSDQNSDSNKKQSLPQSNITSLKLITKKQTYQSLSVHDKTEHYLEPVWDVREKEFAKNSPYSVLKSYTVRQIIVKVA